MLSMPVLKQTRVGRDAAGARRASARRAVTQVHFYVNDAKAFVAAAREHLAQLGPRPY